MQMNLSTGLLMLHAALGFHADRISGPGKPDGIAKIYQHPGGGKEDYT